MQAGAVTVAVETCATARDAAAELAAVCTAAAVAAAYAEEDATVRMVKRSRASDGASREPRERRRLRG